MKKILVTGGAGYIGSILCRKLLEKGYQVRVIDILKFGQDSLRDIIDDKNFELIVADIRDQEMINEVLQGVDAVIHLASIVGDPACKKEPELAREVNLNASMYLLEAAQKSGVSRFIFASTCSNYGKMDQKDGYINEDAPLKPVSLYAQLKVEFEQILLESGYEDGFTVTGLRFATAYGLSPRMRFDLTVNEFTKELCLGRELVVFGEQFWRPYCHIKDLSNACISVLEADRAVVHKNVFNVGDTEENYQKKTIVDLLTKRLPKGRIKFVHKDEDPRDYRVNFDKIRNQLNFSVSTNLDDGIDEILESLKKGLIKDPDNKVYKNS